MDYGGYADSPPPPSEEEEDLDPLVHKFGQDPLVKEARDAGRIRELVSGGAPVTANAVFAAVETLHRDTLEVLLDFGASPNMRLEPVMATNTGVNPDWSTRDVSPVFSTDQWREWYPLQFVAHAPNVVDEDRDRQSDLMTLLIHRGADSYALFRQSLRRSQPFPFPGDEHDHAFDPEEDEEYDAWAVTSAGPRLYGVRSVIHSILEDGGCIKPFFDESFQLNVETRDPQGRTVLHSACRSALGADAIIDGVLEDVHWSTDRKAYKRNPFISSDDQPSLFHTLRLRNADLLALDDSGKHVLHHLMEAQDSFAVFTRPPMIKNTLNYVLEELQPLINQPDHSGTYPLHAALQRLRRHPINNWSTETASLESEVDRLLAAGANPLAHDGRGNTALHYLADDGMLEKPQGEQIRRLFKAFLDRGVDVNKRNKSGRTALELLLERNKTTEWRHDRLYSLQYKDEDIPTIEKVEARVLTWFDESGVNWTGEDAHGRSLLHIVADNWAMKADSRAEFLLAKGVDPTIKDKDGRTALDLATACSNQKVMDILSTRAK